MVSSRFNLGVGGFSWQSLHSSPRVCALGTTDQSQQVEQGSDLAAKACLRVPTAFSILGGTETLSLESEACPAQKGELGTPKATDRGAGMGTLEGRGKNVCPLLSHLGPIPTLRLSLPVGGGSLWGWFPVGDSLSLGKLDFVKRR